jgi:hypothetical protein
MLAGVMSREIERNEKNVDVIKTKTKIKTKQENEQGHYVPWLYGSYIPLLQQLVLNNFCFPYEAVMMFRSPSILEARL